MQQCEPVPRQCLHAARRAPVPAGPPSRRTADNWQRRTRSSTGVGDGPSRSTTCGRGPEQRSEARLERLGPWFAEAASGGARGPPGGGLPGSGCCGRLSSTSAAVSVRMRALAQQVVAAARPRIERRAGHGEHLAPGVLCQPRGDQAAGAERRLHHHHAERQARDDAVAAGEMAGLRRGAEGRLGDHRARLGDPPLQVGVLRRVGHVQAAGDHGDRCGRCASRRYARRRRCRGRGRKRQSRGAASSAARFSAMRWPLAEALRPPTSATARPRQRIGVAQHRETRAGRRPAWRAGAGSPGSPRNSSRPPSLARSLDLAARPRRRTGSQAAARGHRRGPGAAGRPARRRRCRSGRAGGAR